jgi:UDP-N-acetylmuramate: L-alanyl-gamma-D-glutamyl-meso-diaminopimelate ligase
MAGIAQLAKSNGYSVQGCDSNVYPPMSTLLKNEQIPVFEGYDPAVLNDNYDQVIIGNALSRGNPLVEAILDQNFHYQSGPQWLHDNLLRHRNVIAVAGTHGKTTTSSMVAWIMQACGKRPGFLIGGRPGNFEASARLGESEWFVVEADEYDTAFFDKRSKFVHYNPGTVILNNLEFDHADIFDDLDQIKKQFHHLIRIVPSSGSIIANDDDPNIADVLAMGCWSRVVPFSVHNQECRWFASNINRDFSSFEVFHNQQPAGVVEWSCVGRYNMANALAAIVAANISGIPAKQACEALSEFKATDRRLQLLLGEGELYLYEDFAHHPTAISATIDALKQKHPNHEILAVVEPRSNTMKRGCHGDLLGEAFNGADYTIVYQPGELSWQPEELHTSTSLSVCKNSDDVIHEIDLMITGNSVIICMSNGDFDGIPEIIREHLHTIFV